VCSSTFIPLLTLGIPGDTITAIMLGAFMVHGLVPGPALFAEHMDFVTAFFVAMAVCTLMHLVIGRAGLPLFMQAVKIPTQLLFPIVVVLCATGVYVSSNSYFDMVVMLAFGGAAADRLHPGADRRGRLAAELDRVAWQRVDLLRAAGVAGLPGAGGGGDRLGGDQGNQKA
jgi:hypothetical protein